MIVYNVERRLFALHDAANTYRRERGLKPGAITKIRIEDRDELATLLDGLCNTDIVAVRTDDGMMAMIPQDVSVHPMVPPDADIPKFLRDSWQRISEGRGVP